MKEAITSKWKVFLACFLLTSLFAGWWVTWPERTVRKFLGALNTNQFDVASGMVITPADREVVQLMKDVSEWGLTSVAQQGAGRRPAAAIQFEYGERTWSDILQGRAFFFRLDTGFYVQRGRVSFSSFDEQP